MNKSRVESETVLSAIGLNKERRRNTLIYLSFDVHVVGME